MRLDRTHRRSRLFRRCAIGATAVFAMLLALLGPAVHADPADDALAKLHELSRQAEQTTEAMHSAQLDLNEKLAAQQAAEQQAAADAAAAEAARQKLANFQAAIDKFAVAQYMGGRVDGEIAILTADSPQQLIDRLSVQRVMRIEMANQMQAYRAVAEQARLAAEASARSAAEARTAAEQAAAVRAELQAKQSRLQEQIAVVQAQYEALTPQQREILAEAPPPPPSVLPPAPAPAPEAAPEAPPAPDPAIVAAPGGPQVPPGDLAPPAGDRIGVVQAALSRLGSMYSWGAAGPNAFDCSGLVMWAFREGAGINLPHSSQALARGGQPVSMDQMQPGDLITYYSDASHVGIYIGDGMMVHAPTFGAPVRVAPVNNAPIHNIRRY
ncbi:peptidoglycan hydrolase RipC [uncultured Mycolicibacterium sp.]|uniref:peptidoglycan hydrolase RipC n=1 Tax=uncultured Mycolicibacterium sp. TaxID=2320817 RepID=UPI002602BF3D|nr:peptidoglycan hydrolase RipC [uncultured Mycolicibacterium sp.]